MEDYMSETVNQEVNVAPETEERTFTQAELDAIVTERLKRDRAKYADYEALKEKADKFDQIEEANKSELEKAIERSNALENELNSLKKAAEIRTMRDSVSSDTGVPASLLTADTEDGCREQAKAILAFKGTQTYPNVRDAGEVDNNFRGSPKQQFADWANQLFG